jgi:hypothetical protein
MQGTSAGAAAQQARTRARMEANAMQRERNRAQLAAMLPGGQVFKKTVLDAEAQHMAKIEASRRRMAGIESALTANLGRQQTSMANIARQRRLVAEMEEAITAPGAVVDPNAPFGGRGQRRTYQEHLQILKGMEMQYAATQAAGVKLTRSYSAEADAQSRLIAGNQDLVSAMSDLHNRSGMLISKNQALEKAYGEDETALKKLAAQEQLYLRQENSAKWLQRARMVEHFGHVLTVVGLGATAAFGIAAKTAADFNTQAILAATQARPPGAGPGRTAQIAQRLNAVILQQMQQFPATADEMSKALYSIFSGTNIQQVSKAAKLLRVFNMEAVAGGTDLDTMTQAGITLFNNFPNLFRNATRAGDRFFAMVRYGRGTADEFAASLSPILPIAKGAGQTFDDVAGTLAFLSRQSRDVTANAQGYARLLLLIARPEVRAGFKRLGIDVLDAQKRVRPLLDIVTDLQKRRELPRGAAALTFFKDISQAATGRGTAGTIQAQRAWQRIVENVNQYREVSRRVVRDNDEFRQSFEALSKAPGVRWRVFINQLKALVILVGEQAIPAFTAMGAKIVELVQWFRQLSPHTQHLIGYFGAFVAVATLAGGVILTITAGFASLFFTLRLLTGGRGLAALAAESGAAQTRLLLLMGVVGPLLYIFIQYPGTLHTATRALGGVTNAVELLTAALIALKLRGAIGGGFLGRNLGLGRGILGTASLTGYLYMLEQIAKESHRLHQHHQSFLGQLAHDLRPTPFFKGLASNTVALFTGGQAHVWENAGRAKVQAFARGFGRGADQTFNRFVGNLTKFQNPFNKIATSGKAVANHIRSIAQAAEGLGLTRITANFQQLFNALVRAQRQMNRALAEAAKDPTLANRQRALQATNRYLAAKKALESSADKDRVTAAEKVSSAITKVDKQRLAKQKDDLKSAVDNIGQMYQDLLQQNQQQLGTLFQGPFLQSPMQQAMREWGVQMKPGDLLRDLRSQVFAFRRFHGTLNRLAARGAPAQLIQQLQQLGPEALPQIQLLTKMAPRQWREYIAVYQQGQDLVKRQTMRDLRAQLHLYRTYGKNIGRQIVLGLRDQSAPMRSEIRSLVLSMFPELRPGSGRQRQRGGQQQRQGQGNHYHHHEHDHTNINVKPGDYGGVGEALARDRFRKKHKPRSPRIRR